MLYMRVREYGAGSYVCEGVGCRCSPVIVHDVYYVTGA